MFGLLDLRERSPCPDPEDTPRGRSMGDGAHPTGNRGYTRREFLLTSGKAGLAGAVASRGLQVLRPQPAGAATVLSKAEHRTLRAAVARIVPAEQPGDWS